MRVPRRPRCDRLPAWSGLHAQPYRSTSEPRSGKSLPRLWAGTADLAAFGRECLVLPGATVFHRHYSESISGGIVQKKCSVFHILKWIAPNPFAWRGVPPEAVLFHGQPNPRPSVGDGVSRARQPERTHTGRDRRGDPFRAHDRDEMARAHGGVRPGGRRTRARPGPSRPEDRVPTESRGMGPGDEAPVPIALGHRGGPRSGPRPDADAGRGDP